MLSSNSIQLLDGGVARINAHILGSLAPVVCAKQALPAVVIKNHKSATLILTAKDDRRGLFATHLWQQLLDRHWHDLVVKGFHAFAADFEVEAGQHLFFVRGLFDDLLGHLFADVLLQPIGIERRGLCNHLANRVIDLNFVPVLAPFLVLNGADLFAQVIPIRRLVTVDKRHLVVATLSSHDHDALEGEVEPAFGLGDEGCIEYAQS